MRVSKGHTHAIASSKIRINVRSWISGQEATRKWILSFNNTARETLDAKFTYIRFLQLFFTTLVKRERKRKLENEGISKMKIVGVETRRWMVFFCSFSVSFRRKWRQSLSFSPVQRKISKKFFHSYQFTVPIIS